MKIALIQWSVNAGSIDANLAAIETRCEAAVRDHGVELCCLPELCTTGFNWKLNRALAEQGGATRAVVSGIARAHRVALCGSFLETNDKGRPVNRFLFFEENGEVVAAYDKAHLFSAFREDQNIDGGTKIEAAATRFGIIGPAVCYDLRFPEVFRKLTLEGAFLHLVPAAFPKPRLAHWRTLIQARAVENHSFVVGINQCGFEGPVGSSCGTEYFGHSMAVSPTGEILAECGEGEATAIVEIREEAVQDSRKVYDSIRDRRPELYG